MSRRVALCAALVLCVLVPPNIFSCAVSFPEPVFVRRQAPDDLTRFTAGDIGIVQPTYSAALLVIAYRYLSGAPLSENERAAALHYWKAINGDEGDRVAGAQQSEHDAQGGWQDASEKVPGVKPPAKSTENGQTDVGWSTYANCTDGAFENAAKTLQQRINAFGATSRWVREWVEAQNAVFTNCSGAGDVPRPAPAGAPAIIAADRQYQLAAAKFYAGKYDDAASDFRQISAEAQSPWRELAPYLVARALIRKSTLTACKEVQCSQDFDPVTMQAAEKQLRDILANTALRSQHGPARQLLGFVESHLHPLEYTAELAQRLSKRDPDFEHDLSDFGFTLRKVESADQSGKLFVPPAGPQSAKDYRTKDSAYFINSSDTADWLVTMRAQAQPAPAAHAHAVQRWASTHSIPWLLAALQQAEAGEPQAAALIEAAAAVPRSSPAFAAANYHRIHLLISEGRDAEARQLLDGLLRTLQMTRSSENAFRSERMQVASTLDEFLTFAQQKPAAQYDNTNSIESPVAGGKSPYVNAAFGDLAVAVLDNNFPLKRLAEAAQSPVLPLHLRRDVAVAAWTRAALLSGDQEIAVKLSNVLARLAPQMKGGMDAYRSSVAASTAASTDNDVRRFAGVFLILHFPGFRPWLPGPSGRYGCCDGPPEPLGTIDDFRANWWCAPENQNEFPPDADSEHPHATPQTSRLLFITPEEDAQSNREHAELLTTKGSDFLAAQTIAFARSHPSDPRVPEALHFAIRATRFGCTTPETGKLSKQAFELLHRRYGETEWAKKTPYWFN